MGLIRRCSRYLFYFGRSFIYDGCPAKAAALSFYSLLAIVPFLAILFGIAQAVGFGSALEQALTTSFRDQPEVGQKLIEFARSSLENAKGGIIAGVGVIVLLWSAMGLLDHVENTFNAIWKTQKQRTYWQQLRDYSLILAIAPLFLIVSSAINLCLGTQLRQWGEQTLFAEVEMVWWVVLNVVPFLLMWALLVMVYVFMPNIRVRFKDVVMAAIVAAVAFQVWQWIYIQIQMGVSSYGAIYGSFAALPLFLLWLQVSWLIVLAGAELVVTPFPA